MALLTITDAYRGGINASFSSPVTSAHLNVAAASAGGDRFVNTGKEVIVVYPAGGSLTLTCASNIEGLADNAVVMSSAVPFMIGPFPVSDFGADVLISYSTVSNVFLQVIKVVPGA